MFDLAGLLDRVASRRYLEDPSARPTWWDEVGGAYPLPPALANLPVPPSSHFFASGPTGRVAGGLFSLDGVHPTTGGYGLIAQEIIRIMQTAGVKFYWGDEQQHVREGAIEVDFERLLQLDSLLHDPPRSLSNSVSLLGWLDQRVDKVLSLLCARVQWP